MEKQKFKISEQTELEKAAFNVVRELQEAGFETYIAGGAVRDFFLKKEVHDIDIATSAEPKEVKKVFPESYDRGKAFGVVAVKAGGAEFEVATFRSDIGTTDHRRPEKIEFTTAENDAKRRDFTINALFYNPSTSEIIDFVGGLRDLKNKIVRFVGNPKVRIKEDYLRMLRAVRFTYRLGFKLEEESARGIKENAKEILKISKERIRDELTLILTGQNRSKALVCLGELSLLSAILPEFILTKNVTQPPEFHSEGDVWTHTLMAMETLGDSPVGGPSAELAWTVLLHDIGKPETQGFRDHPKSKITFFEHDARGVEIAKEILERLKFSHEFIHAVAWAISQHMRIINAFRGMSERKQKKLFTHPHIGLLLDLTKADLEASLRPGGRTEMELYEDALKKKADFEKKASDEEKQQVKKFTLVTGDDIMKVLQISAGPKVGEIKTKIEETYLEGKISTREEALQMIKEYRNYTSEV